MAKSPSDVTAELLDFIEQHPNSSSKAIHAGIDQTVSYATVKRALQLLISDQMIEAHGKSRGTKYALSPSFELLHPIDAIDYFQKEIDERAIKADFNLQLIRDLSGVFTLFTSQELQDLTQLQAQFTKNIVKLTPLEYKKEFERLAIDLSWKSSQIEGNTYSLLETERLLKEHETASGRTKDEASMLLNHKAALDFITEQPDYVHPLSVYSIEDIHSVLIRDLDVPRNIRNRKVGISGTNYRPLDNEFQIKEALAEMCLLINKRKNVFEKALLALVLISYIQPFVDGNKRTARIISNAILMHYQYCPLSFRTVASIEYKKAMLIFYEQNNISAFKQIFIDQFAFAVRTYF